MIQRAAWSGLSRVPTNAWLVLGGCVVGLAAALAIAAGAEVIGIAISVVPAGFLVLRYPWIAVLLWLGLLPLFFQTPDASAGPGIWILHRILVPAMLLVSFAYFVLGFSRSHFRLSLTDFAIVVFLVLGAANIQLLSSNTGRMNVAFLDSFVVPICMYWLVRLIEPNDNDLRRMLPVLAWVLLLQFTVGVLSWVAPGVLPGEWLGREGERTVGTLGGPGPYSVTLIFCTGLIFHRLTGTQSASGRLLLVLLVAAGFYGVVLSFSRGSWLGALVLFAGVIALERRLAAQMVAFAVVLAIILAIGPLGNQLDFAAERLGDESTAASRLITNNAALRMIETSPLIGFGYGNFERFDEQFKERVGEIPVEPGSAHHTYLALAAENGIPALIIYLLPAAWLLLLTVRRWRMLPADGLMNRRLVVILWLVLASEFIVSNFMDMLHSSPWGTTLWWLALGLIHVVITRASAAPRVRRATPVRPVMAWEP
jgi:O-antigen ligase